MINSVFVNLPVENLKRSVDFFTELGFTFNLQFTDEKSTCMIVTDSIYVMLVEHSKFETFVKKPIAPSSLTEAIFGFGCSTADEVRKITERALELGAKKVNDPEDLGFMFSWGFEDFDGHLWDLFWMNPDHIQ